MNKFTNFIKNNYILIGIIFLGALLRFWGIMYDLPLGYSVADEPLLMSKALRMINEKTMILDFGSRSYFPLMYYVYAIGAMVYSLGLLVFTDIGSIMELKESAIVNFGEWLIVGRAINAILGTAAVYLVYLITKQLLKHKNAALIAALLFALSPMHVALSHIAKPWGPQMFFLLLSLYISLKFWQDPNSRITNKKVIITAFFIILSIFTNLYGVLAYPLFLLLIFVYQYQFNIKKLFFSLFSRWSLLLHTLLAGSVLLLAFIGRDTIRLIKSAISIFLLDNSAHLEATGLGAAMNLDTSIWIKVGHSLNTLLQLETIVFFLFIPALFLLKKENRQAFWFLLIAMLILFFTANPPLLQTTRARYFSSLIPFLIIPTAYIISIFYIKLSRVKAWLGLLALFVLILPSLYIDIRHNYLYSINSTKHEIYEWLQTNIKPGETVYIEGIYLQQDLILSPEVIGIIKNYSPDLHYSSRLRYLEKDINKLATRKGIDYYFPGYLCKLPKEDIKKINFDYAIIVKNDIRVKDQLDICNAYKIELNRDQLVQVKNTAPYFDYDIGHSSLIESYTALRGIKKRGPSYRIYKID